MLNPYLIIDISTLEPLSVDIPTRENYVLARPNLKQDHNTMIEITILCIYIKEMEKGKPFE